MKLIEAEPKPPSRRVALRNAEPKFGYYRLGLVDDGIGERIVAAHAEGEGADGGAS